MAIARAIKVSDLRVPTDEPPLVGQLAVGRWERCRIWEHPLSQMLLQHRDHFVLGDLEALLSEGRLDGREFPHQIHAHSAARATSL
ncbi:MAG: hypothetical protein ACYDEA_12065 [Candidatus Dormibacteria bacterium]